ncbi:MAG: hypothetical protein JXA25_18415 [Anaerolineales bacterium]|nr:hypothetical protein [Anaerolineales bacterium]
MSKKPKEEPQGKEGTFPILLLETSFTISKILVVVVLVLTVVFSLMAGCSWKAVVLRAGSVTLILGFVLYAINWLISDGTLDVIFKQLAALKQDEPQSSTQEWKV